MKKNIIQGKGNGFYSRFLLAAGYTLFLSVLTAVLFDYYFDLNDDVLIKDILAGVHTGTPSGYSIQMLYPISVFISFFYRMLPEADWYGLFLCGCQYLSVFLVAYRSLEMLEWAQKNRIRWWKRIGLLLLEGILVYALLLYVLVYVQYTVTCGFLVAAAAFLLYTTPQVYDAKRFWKVNVISMLCLVAAFCIRTEMFLLLLPFVGAAGLGKWGREGFIRQSRKYGLVIGLVAVGLAAAWLGDGAAHRSGEWQEFRRVFDARTQIYDFYELPEYDVHEAFYTGAGITAEEYELLSNYNYGVDDAIDADKLEAVEAYARSVYEQSRTVGERFRDAIWNYRERIFGEGEAPRNQIVILAYLCVAAGLLCAGRPILLWQPLLLFAARSVSWFYIEYRGRVVPRITMPLYLIELLLLAAMFWQDCRRSSVSSDADEKKMLLNQEKMLKWCISAAVLVLTVWGIVWLPDSIQEASQEQERRAQKNRPYQALQEYCRKNSEHFYYVDVYSTVYFSEKMFEKVDNSKRNYDIIGGWACKSPISGHEEFSYLITDSKQDIVWLENYLARKEPDKTVKKQDEIIVKDSDVLWEVYKIEQKLREKK